jgi:hypothetical protein
VTYGLNDGAVAYYTSLGCTGTVADMEYQFLQTYTGGLYPTASTNDLWGIFCAGAGFSSGTIQERRKALLNNAMVTNIQDFNDCLTAFYNFELAYTPRDLFQAGANGAWYDFSELTTLYQDSAGTIPVTAVGDPVGRVLDRSGEGHHLVQTTSTKRPLLGLSNGKYYLDFDGVDDALVSVDALDLTATKTMTTGIGMWRDTTTTADIALEHGRGGTDAQAMTITHAASSTNLAAIMRGPTGSPQTTIVDSGRITTEAFFDRSKATVATQVIQRMNGNAVTNTASSTVVPTTSFFGNYNVYVGARNQVTNPFDGKIFQIVIVDSVLSGADLTNLEAWLNARTGAY